MKVDVDTEVTKYECGLCPRECRIAPGESGFCRARGVPDHAGKGVVSLNYGKVTSLALDPIEKKPLYHFHPGAKILSVGSFGCNLRCPWCQNHSISMAGAEDSDTRYIGPAELAELAEQTVAQGNIGVAYTYNEPLIGFEYARDAVALVRDRGLKNVLVTNGYARREAFLELLPYLDALNIDLKSMNPDFYLKIGGDLETVLENIRLAATRCHIELTCLLIDGENDSEAEMEMVTDFIASVSPEIPLHISRFFPLFRYKDRAPTRVETMLRFEEIARQKLKYIHLGNI